jgi:hypothetical protein
MNRFLRTLLLWLLLAALPGQGMAAAIHTACGPAEHHDPAKMAMLVHVPLDDAMDMSRSDAVEDGAMTKVAMSPDKSHAEKHKHTACNACANCCAGAAAPPSTLVSPPAYSDSLVVTLSPSPMAVGFIPAGLERPPKRITT